MKVRHPLEVFRLSPGNVGTYNSAGGKENRDFHSLYYSVAKPYTKLGKAITEPEAIAKHYEPVPEPIVLETYRKYSRLRRFLNKHAKPLMDWLLERKLKRFERKVDELYRTNPALFIV